MLSVMLLFAAFDLVTVISGVRLHYGESHMIRLQSRGVKFTHRNVVDAPDTLWTSKNRTTIKDPRHSFDGMYYTLHQLTQRDSGQYVLLDRNNRLLSETSIIVEENEENYDLMVGDHLDFQYGFKPMNCNVNFISGYSSESKDIVYQGRLKDLWFCKGIEFYQPCRISIGYADFSCGGVYEFTDSNGDVALRVELDISKPPEEPGMPNYGWVGIASACCAALCSCLKCCCCKKSKKKDSSDSEEAADPAEEAELTGVQGGVQFVSEPARLVPRETRELPYPAAAPQPPTVAPSATLIHDAPTFDLPSYEEALDMPSTADPRFNFTGMSFSADPPLSSEATGSDVYTSDKLNFL